MANHRHCGSCGAFIDRNPEHPCPMYREEPPLPEGDPDFQVIPDRTLEQVAESLRRYRRAVRCRATQTMQEPGNEILSSRQWDSERKWRAGRGADGGGTTTPQA